jgi:hypothetical protein
MSDTDAKDSDAATGLHITVEHCWLCGATGWYRMPIPGTKKPPQWEEKASRCFLCEGTGHVVAVEEKGASE